MILCKLATVSGVDIASLVLVTSYMKQLLLRTKARPILWDTRSAALIVVRTSRRRKVGICVGPRDNSHVNQKAHVIQKVNDVRHVYEDVNASRDAIEITWIFAALLIHLRSYSAEILSLRLILSRASA